MSKISILTPSYNYGRFLPTAIRSTLQEPRNANTDIEHVVMDGASTDETVAILRKFVGTSLTWRSERDQGQSDALNKALSTCSGDIIGWLNADDFYLPGAIRDVELAFTADPELDILIGDTMLVDAEGRLKRLFRSYCPPRAIVMYRGTTLMSTSMFFRRSTLGTDPFDVRLRRVMDWDLYLQLLDRPGMKLGYLGRPLGAFRFHDDQVTSPRHSDSGENAAEQRLIYEKHHISPRRAKVLKPMAIAAHRMIKMANGHHKDENASRQLAGIEVLDQAGRVHEENYDKIVALCYRKPSQSSKVR